VQCPAHLHATGSNPSVAYDLGDVPFFNNLLISLDPLSVTAISEEIGAESKLTKTLTSSFTDHTKYK